MFSKKQAAAWKAGREILALVLRFVKNACRCGIRNPFLQNLVFTVNYLSFLFVRND